MKLLLKKLSELKKPEPPLVDETYLKLKEAIRKRGVMVPLLVYQNGTIVDGKRRYWILEELQAEGMKVTFVPCVVIDSEADLDSLRAEINVYRRSPRISELLILAGQEVRENEVRKKRCVDELVDELLRARGIGPRIFQALVLQTKVSIPVDFDANDESEEGGDFEENYAQR